MGVQILHKNQLQSARVLGLFAILGISLLLLGIAGWECPTGGAPHKSQPRN